ncbi:MAG: DUF951 domain-containing protein [Clostridiales bacterium]|nr:DUF951 domain-containing protein [Clostridiales bacterium]
MPVQYSIGDIVQTRKQHPCGNDKWEIIRVGADFKIKCLNCGRVVMFDRENFEKRVKKILKSDEV